MNPTGADRLPIVGVMGSGRDAHVERAGRLGRWLAALPVHLLTGGGGGVMTSVSRAFCEVPARAGRVIGVLPGIPADRGGCRAPAGYPNPWVEIPIATHLPRSGAVGTDPLSRNHVNVLTADVVVALPGGRGTASEVELALRYGRPTIVWADAPRAVTGLPECAVVEPDFAKVQAFVRSAVG